MARTAASVSKKIGSNRPKSEGRQHHLGRGGAGTTGTLPQRAVVDRLGGTREGVYILCFRVFIENDKSRKTQTAEGML